MSHLCTKNVYIDTWAEKKDKRNTLKYEQHLAHVSCMDYF